VLQAGWGRSRAARATPQEGPGAPGTYRGCWPPSGDARARGETSRPGAVGAAWAFVAKDSCEYPTLLFQFPGHF
jgi:hypothetical protein